MELKNGYITVHVMGIDSYIVDSNGFSFETLQKINEQIKEPEEFQSVEEGFYVFKPEYSAPEIDRIGRVIVPGYWGFKEDKYAKAMKKKINKELEWLEKGVESTDARYYLNSDAGWDCEVESLEELLAKLIIIDRA
ncbi:MAG: hypothetical protein ACOCSL_05090, partial [Thermoplasmatota archaeon]